MTNAKKTVLSIGQCRPDQAAISHFLTTHFNVTVLTADSMADSLELLSRTPVQLVLINRKLDLDYSDGMEILKEIRNRKEWESIVVMLVSNYPEWQEKAVAMGAVPGFGKAELNQQKTRDRLASVLLTSEPVVR